MTIYMFIYIFAYTRIFKNDDQGASPNREQVVGNKSYTPQSTKRHVSRREAPFSYILRRRRAGQET